jgi:HK97 gp10 family phage protein
VGAHYGAYVEYGTRYMAAQPYFRPAVEEAKRQFIADMRQVFGVVHR